MLANKLIALEDKECNNRVINVTVSDFMLTPLSCAYLINEVIKCLVYQKSQIPYPYNWLKTMVNKKRAAAQEQLDGERPTKSKTSFTVSNHYRQASATYDTLTELMRALVNEFTKPEVVIEEVAIMFGIVPQCPHQLYKITLPELSLLHVDKNHIDDCIKHQHNVLRRIFMSQPWMESLDERLNTLNTYVFLKKRQAQAHGTDEDSFFLPAKPVDFTVVRKQLTISMDYDNTQYLNLTCCKFDVFNETSPQDKVREEQKDCTEEQEEDRYPSKCSQWFGARSPVTGFKDCFVNKVSASHLW